MNLEELYELSKTVPATPLKEKTLCIDCQKMSTDHPSNQCWPCRNYITYARKMRGEPLPCPRCFLRPVSSKGASYCLQCSEEILIINNELLNERTRAI